MADIQKNANGEIAIAYYQPVQKLIRMGDGTQYVFMTHANICLAWVQEKHTGQLLAQKKKCCGGGGGPMFRYANESDVRRWTNRGGA